jgi:hypothetical protein
MMAVIAALLWLAVAVAGLAFVFDLPGVVRSLLGR